MINWNDYKLPDPRWFIPCALGMTLLMLCLFLGLAKGEEYSDEEIATAIYKAEGGAKAKVPYGILSIKVSDKEEAKRICLNTIRNNRKRFANQSIYKDFLEFLASRYAPIKGATNDPKNLNKNWLKNVRYFLKKGAERWQKRRY